MATESEAVRARAPAAADLPHARLVRRAEACDGSEPVVELVRVVGPGRIERRYRSAITLLEESLASLEVALAARSRELAAAELVERGARARLDKLELEAGVQAKLLGLSRERERALEREARRMCATLGALARENELLRDAERRRLAEPAPRATSADPLEGAPADRAARARRRLAERDQEKRGWLGRLWRRRA